MGPSDLTLVCEEQEFKIHKAVVCPQSPVLAAAANGHFQVSRDELRAGGQALKFETRRPRLASSTFKGLTDSRSDAWLSFSTLATMTNNPQSRAKV